MKHTIAPMSIGEIFARAMSLFFARIGLFLAIEVIVVSPTLVLQLVFPELAMGAGAGLFVLPMLILGPIGSAAMLHVIAQEYLGRPVSLVGAFQVALGRFLPLLGTSILAGFGIVIGAIFCCVPGIYLAIIWAFVSQVVVMEDTAGAPALVRSKDLVMGYFWQVFGVIFTVGVIVWFASFSIHTILVLGLPYQEIPPPNPNNPFQGLQGGRMTSYVNFAINEVVATVVQGIGQTFAAICTTLLYFDLRNRKEAFDVSHIIAWMDRYPNWRDEPIEENELLRGNGAAPETGIKQPGDVVPPPLPPETRIHDPSDPRSGDPPPR
jgi:hypothetical protein